ncbi:MAG: UPF0182 family protein [Gemmatimonadales bacterium]|nr:UPF0182 family protein [Gemmatimonadales bacterium]
MNRRSPFTVLMILALLVGVLMPMATGLLVDYWWFQDLGFEVLFSRTITTRLLLFVIAAMLTGALVWANLRFAQRGAVADVIRMQVHAASGEQMVDLSRVIGRLTRPVTLALAVMFGLGASALWDVALQASLGTPFGTTDPVFGRDIGFYVFTLPALSALLGILASLAVLLLLLLVVIYYLRGDIVVAPRRLRIEPSAGMHLAIVLAIVFVLWALQLWFVDTSNLLFSRTGPLVGASYTDMHATLPALRVSAVVALLAAVAVIVGGVRRQLGAYAVGALALYGLVAVIGRGLIPGLVQKFVVAPTELTREEPFLGRHITATRLAWGIDSVEVRDLEGEATLDLATIRNNAATIDNVRLWDREPLLRTFSQIQEIRTYYDFVSVDDDRYWIDGRYRQVLLAPRELNSASLPTRTFINEHLTFTHGMGLTLSPVNEVTTEGLPVLFVKDLPPSTTGSLRISRPQIYYGELTDNFVFVNTKQKEFDYPSGEANVYSTYDGTGGVPVGGIVRRAILAAEFGSSKILLSGDITAESRVLFHRNIVARVKKAFPFLRLDRDPYMVVASDGTLQWIQDAYTATSRYPYSYRTNDGVSYIRNSVKIVIDAYHGTVTPYIAEPDDPLIRTWASVYPGVFKPIDEMPEDLRAHIRYPDELFRAQTARYVTYHMDTPATFYNREDEWQVPVITRNDQAVPFMRHIVMRLPEEEAAEFIYMAPFTPRGKDNLAAWMVARNDGDHYGKLRVYRFPRQSLVFGPRQIENRINQDTEISRQVSLWDQRGSEVIRGDLLVIPIEESLLYVQPIYLQAGGGMIPELKRVVVAYQNQVIMRETLDAALAEMFGGRIGAPGPDGGAAQLDTTRAVGAAAPGGTTTASAESVAEARRHYEAAIDAQRQGDWARYGEELRQLGAALERLGARGTRP